DYPSYIENVRRELSENIDSLPRLEGEFRSSQRSNVLAGVLSTRIWLKQRYQQCEDLLARYAEPLSAWRYLLEQGTRETSVPAHPEVSKDGAVQNTHSENDNDYTRGLPGQCRRII